MSGFSFKQLQEQAKEAGIGEPLPPGRYIVKAIETTAKQTKSGDKDQIEVKFSVVEGPHANRKLFNNYVISPENNNALAFFFRHMAAFGLNSDYFSSNPTVQQVAAEMRDKIVEVDVIIDNYGGVDRNKVKNTYPSSGAVASAPSDPFRAAAPAPAPVADDSTPQAPAPPF